MRKLSVSKAIWAEPPPMSSEPALSITEEEGVGRGEGVKLTLKNAVIKGVKIL